MGTGICNFHLVIGEVLRFLRLTIHCDALSKALQIGSLACKIDLSSSGLDDPVIDKCLEISVDRGDQQTLIIVAVGIFAM